MAMALPENQLNQNQPLESVDLHTNVNVDEKLFRWSLKDMLILPYENGTCIESLQFSSPENPENEWIRIYPNGEKDSDKNNISIFLVLLSDESTKFPAKVTFSFWNSKTNHSFKQITFDCEFEGPHSEGCDKFCTHQEFLEGTAVEGEIHDVIIECKIVTRGELEHTLSPSFAAAVGPEEEESGNSLSSDFNNLLKSKKFADFTLVSSDGVEFRAHKNILYARSPFFSAMLQNSDLIEGQQNRVVIADANSNTLKELVQYIYAGKCDNLDTMANELLVGSDKYQLNSLKNSAVRILNRTMSMENVLDICVNAHLSNAPGLKKNALFFLKRNMNEIVKLGNWESFVKDYPSLVTELFCL